MPRILMAIVIVGGMIYLYKKDDIRTAVAPQSVEQQAVSPSQPLPEALTTQTLPPPVLSMEEIQKIRHSTRDSDPSVRWAAIELLYRIRDPKVFDILEESLSLDTEVSVRRHALELLKESRNPGVVQKLIKALRDSEKDMRLAALLAIGELGDPSATADIIEMTKDIEPDVRRQALNTLGRIQEKRQQEHKHQQDLLRQEYEKALHRNDPVAPDGGFFDKTKRFQ
jgi:hypothetical protein